jgi:hypothetical protein
VTAQLWDVSIETNPGEQRGNLRPEPAGLSFFFLQSIAENVTYLFLHASPMARSAALQPHFDLIFQVANYKLSQAESPLLIS